MDQEKDIKKELEEISPFLAGLDKKQDFKVPVNYFENLQDEIWEKVRPQQVVVQEKQVSPTWLEQVEAFIASLFQPRMALAMASVLVLLTAGWFFLQDTEGTSLPLAEENPLFEEASDYLAQHLDDFDAELLLQLELDDEELSQVGESSFPGVEELDDFFDEMLDEVDMDDLEQLL